jgi:hypothetical protein
MLTAAAARGCGLARAAASAALTHAIHEGAPGLSQLILPGIRPDEVVASAQV